jgi:flagellar biosynthesis chaperone FliJ
MKEKILKELERLNQEKDKHEKNLQQLSAARENCIATINATIGAIEVLEKLLKPEEEVKKEGT